FRIISTLIKEFLLLVLIAGIIASPIAWYFMNEGLNEFAYRISISWYYIVLSILISMAIAVITIIHKAYKSANSDPVIAIKYE
ncbi:MAG: ABC transporter permease, partial [Bacteroidetes bacterium]|nr:ABC transporter permease [Bacteroidota bacterium]